MYEPKIHKVKGSPREIEPKLLKLMVDKANEIFGDEFRKAVELSDALTLDGMAGDVLTAMKVREKTNRNDGVLVEMIQKTDGGSKGDAWCMWQQQTQTAFAESLTGKLSKLPSTGSCARMRDKAAKLKIDIPMSESRYGDKWIRLYPGGTGHTGSFKSWITKGVSARLNEGNTTAGKLGDKVIREGGGSYLTERNIKDKGGNWIMAVRSFEPLAMPKPGEVPEAEMPKAPEPATKPAAEAFEVPQYGEHSDRVATLQRAANQFLTVKLNVDGKYGPKSKEGFSTIQRMAGLVPHDGILTQETCEYLEGAQSAPIEKAGTPENPNWDFLARTGLVDADRVAEADKIANKIKAARVKNKYDDIAKIVDCEWWMVGMVHYRESGALTPTVYLHNGQALGRTTTIVPKGKFYRKDQWIEASVDAMKPFRGCHSEGKFYELCERYNGLGYRKKVGDRGVVEYSPYVVAGTNHSDETGKYIADGVFSKTAKDKQLGVMAVVKRLLATSEQLSVS